MVTLTYGYKKPQTGDTGDKFFPAGEFNIQRINDHAHNGVDSAFLTVAGIAVTAASFIPTTGAQGAAGIYEQELTLPAGRLFDTTQIWFRSSIGNTANLSIAKTAANKFKVYTNQPAEVYTVFYR